MFPMSKYCTILAFLIIGFLGSTFSQSIRKYSRACDSYNPGLCKMITSGCTMRGECFADDRHKDSPCYSLLQFNSVSEKSTAKLKGCFPSIKVCYDYAMSLTRTPGLMGRLFFCCCEEKAPKGIAISMSRYPVYLWQVLPIVIPTAIIPIFVSVICYFAAQGRFRKGAINITRVKRVFSGTVRVNPNPDFSSMEMVEQIGRGRFGGVWKARWRNGFVAVKVFPIKHKKSWEQERKIYMTRHLKHRHVLKFIGAAFHCTRLREEYLLITAYHEKGSLFDYLSANVVTWSEMCKIAESIGRGLMHLHEELPGTVGSCYKPTVAHRDFKSKDVLLNADMTACIADFDLALAFYPGKHRKKTQVRVGTLIYMAPEVLKGEIDFMMDSFLRIDMYACGLVLWEMVSRCSMHHREVIAPYKRPFERLVGRDPTLEDMQRIVVDRKQRPVILQSWRRHPGLSAFCEMIEWCWDDNAGSRMSAVTLMGQIFTICTTRPLPY